LLINVIFHFSPAKVTYRTTLPLEMITVCLTGNVSHPSFSGGWLTSRCNRVAVVGYCRNACGACRFILGVCKPQKASFTQQQLYNASTTAHAPRLASAVLIAATVGHTRRDLAPAVSHARTLRPIDHPTRTAQFRRHKYLMITLRNSLSRLAAL